MPAGRPARRLRRLLHEWPAIVATSLMLGFWLLWPDLPYAGRSIPNLPEPAAAYVHVDASEGWPVLRPDRFAHPAGEGFGPMPELPLMSAPSALASLPPPPYLQSGPATGNVSTAFAPPVRPPLLPCPEAPFVPTPPVAGAPPSGTVVRVRLSPALARAGFRFDAPDRTPPVTMRFSLMVDSGRVAHVLSETDVPQESLRRWRTALYTGTATNSAVGFVTVERTQ